MSLTSLTFVKERDMNQVYFLDMERVSGSGSDDMIFPGVKQ